MNEKKFSQSLEDYLEAIHIIQKEKKIARVKDIAGFLDVKLPSVTAAIKKLSDEKLIIYERYGYIRLTSKGEKTAKNIYEKHKILFDFFTKILKIDEKTAEKDACKMEHGLSKKTLKKLTLFINKLKGGKI